MSKSVERAKKKEVLRRDNYCCQHCGVPVSRSDPEKATPHIHHITPRAKGGSDAMGNLVTLCLTCHDEEHDGGVTGGVSDREILEILREGRATPAALKDWTGLSGQTVHNRLGRLVAAGHVEKVHDSGLYELVEDPRGPNTK